MFDASTRWSLWVSVPTRRRIASRPRGGRASVHPRKRGGDERLESARHLVSRSIRAKRGDDSVAACRPHRPVHPRGARALWSTWPHRSGGRFIRAYARKRRQCRHPRSHSRIVEAAHPRSRVKKLDHLAIGVWLIRAWRGRHATHTMGDVHPARLIRAGAGSHFIDIIAHRGELGGSSTRTRERPC